MKPKDPPFPGLYILRTSSADDMHDAPTLHGPYGDQEERLRAAAKLYATAAVIDGGDEDEGYYLWRLELPAFTVGNCITGAEAEGAADREAAESRRCPHCGKLAGEPLACPHCEGAGRCGIPPRKCGRCGGTGKAV